MPILYGSKLHTSPTNYWLLAAQQEPCKRAYLLIYKNKNKQIWRRGQENGPLPEERQDRKSNRTRQKSKAGDRKG